MLLDSSDRNLKIESTNPLNDYNALSDPDGSTCIASLLTNAQHTSVVSTLARPLLHAATSAAREASPWKARYPFAPPLLTGVITASWQTTSFAHERLPRFIHNCGGIGAGEVSSAADGVDKDRKIDGKAAGLTPVAPRLCERHRSTRDHWCLGWDDLCMRVAERDLSRTLLSLLHRDRPAIVCTNVSVCARSFGNVQLSSGARRVRDSPNAGGDSILSEVFSCEVVGRLLGAKLLLTEMEVRYFPLGGPMTDYVCEIGGLAISVSVTRAMTAPRRRYTRENARRLLAKKLRGILWSTRNMLMPGNTRTKMTTASVSTGVGSSTHIVNELDWSSDDNLNDLFAECSDDAQEADSSEEDAHRQECNVPDGNSNMLYTTPLSSSSDEEYEDAINSDDDQLLRSPTRQLEMERDLFGLHDPLRLFDGLDDSTNNGDHSDTGQQKHKRSCRDTLYKQILHVWAPSGRVARMIRQEWHKLDAELRGGTLVVVSVVDQPWVFTNRL
ncbi:hypothetical protein THASP1DRAFT_31468 [Thamnocephalis sphaerospora]|uniref:Uncharacterized protein n=1 Tax=Thamnocephalis sphaerospora TaxID=78915 RepID=A0A4P9XLH4_9FUNG|nr:hypothetical protein THASP1DRAFT_31468 [Thamnocephalis sphaerospora]|eukprot:RKP06718.1 hypothetical protein THASP1DRAFT_31468 [Thamnocephalis sphaerospora]